MIHEDLLSKIAHDTKLSLARIKCAQSRTVDLGALLVAKYVQHLCLLHAGQRFFIMVMGGLIRNRKFTVRSVSGLLISRRHNPRWLDVVSVHFFWCETLTKKDGREDAQWLVVKQSLWKRKIKGELSDLSQSL